MTFTVFYSGINMCVYDSQTLLLFLEVRACLQHVTFSGYLLKKQYYSSITVSQISDVVIGFYCF